MGAVHIVHACGNQDLDLLPDQFDRRPAEQVETVQVGVDDDAPEVDDDDHLRNALEQRPGVQRRVNHDGILTRHGLR